MVGFKSSQNILVDDTGLPGSTFFLSDNEQLSAIDPRAGNKKHIIQSRRLINGQQKLLKFMDLWLVK